MNQEVVRSNVVDLAAAAEQTHDVSFIHMLDSQLVEHVRIIPYSTSRYFYRLFSRQFVKITESFNATLPVAQMVRVLVKQVRVERVDRLEDVKADQASLTSTKLNRIEN